MVNPEVICRVKLQEALDALRENKPEERSEEARRYAVTITEMEKVLAYFAVFVVNAKYPGQEVK
jgi:hypothetical protein